MLGQMRQKERVCGLEEQLENKTGFYLNVSFDLTTAHPRIRTQQEDKC